METKSSKAVHSFNYLYSATDEAYADAAARLGMADSTMLILYTLWNSDGACAIHDILSLTGISKQTVNSALRKLEEAGHVTLRPGKGKQKIVHLTPAGTALAANTVQKVIAIENEIFLSWPPEKLQTYLELMEDYLTTFKKRIQEL